MSQTQPRSHLFISYSRSDRIAVDKLAADLRQRGYVLWMDVDERGIEPGEDWRRELVTQMSNAEGVIACGSPDFLDSPFCKAEIEQAQAENKPIYPVLVRRLDATHTFTTFKLDHLQYSDLTLNYDEGLRRLLVALPRPQEQFRNVLRSGRIAAAIVALVILGFVGVMLATRAGIVGIQPTVTPLPTITPMPPTPTVSLANYDVGVLVSYFVVDPPDAIPQDEADQIIANFAQSLDTQLKAELTSSYPTYQMDGPQGVTRITGATRSDRRQSAAARLVEHGAKVVIYGVIHYNADQQRAVLEPEFYIDTGRYFNEAADITDTYAFGKDIPAYATGSNQELDARITALSYIMTGLFDYMTLKYDEALTAYSAALAVSGWTSDDGKEIVYALQGNAYMKQAEQAARRCDRATTLTHTDEADGAYTQSLDVAERVNPDFEARAYAGLANTYALRALWLPEANDQCAANRVDAGALGQADDYIKLYESHLKPADLDGGVRRKLLLTAVQVRFFLWALQAAQDSTALHDPENAAYVAFTDTVQETIAGYADRSDSTWAFPVMEAHIFSGQAHYARGELNAALDDYNAALDIYNDPANRDLLAPERAMTVYGWRGDANLRLGDYVAASHDYDAALKLANDLGVTTAATRYEQSRQQATDRLVAAQTGTPPAATESAVATAELTTTPEVTAAP